MLRRGYELPPLMFTEDEAEGIAVGVRLLARTVRLLTNAPVYVSKNAGSCTVRPAVDDPPRDPRCAQDADRLSDGDRRSTER